MTSWNVALTVTALVLSLAAVNIAFATVDSNPPSTGACYRPSGCQNFTPRSDCTSLGVPDYWVGPSVMCQPKSIGIITSAASLTTPLSESPSPAVSADLEKRCRENADDLARQKCDPKLFTPYYVVYPFTILHGGVMKMWTYPRVDGWYVKCGMVIQCYESPKEGKLGATATPITTPVVSSTPTPTPTSNLYTPR